MQREVSGVSIVHMKSITEKVMRYTTHDYLTFYNVNRLCTASSQDLFERRKS